MSHAPARNFRWQQRVLAAALGCALLGVTALVAGCTAVGKAPAPSAPPPALEQVPALDLATLTGNQRLEHLAQTLSTTRADRARVRLSGPTRGADPELDQPPYSETLVKIWGNGSATEYHTFVDDSGTDRFGTVRHQPPGPKFDFTMAKANIDFLPYPATVIDYRCLSITRTIPVLYGAHPVAELNWYLTAGGAITAETSPSVKIDTVTPLFMDHAIPLDTRRAIWRWLALMPGWTVRDGKDLIDRPGLVFELRDGDNRNELIVDAVTGDLLSVHVDYGKKNLKHVLIARSARTVTKYPPGYGQPAPVTVAFDPDSFYRNCGSTFRTAFL